jgi:hypothetical protein
MPGHGACARRRPDGSFLKRALARTAPVWAAPDLDHGDGRGLILDAPDPFPDEEWAVAGVN